IALDDFRPNTSDIDYVAVTARRPDTAGLTALRRVHALLRTRWPTPLFDGLYVTWEQLAGGPSLAGRGPYSYEGRFHPRADRARATAVSALVELARDLRVRPFPGGGSLYSTPLSRRRDAIAFGEMAVSDAVERFTRSS